MVDSHFRLTDDLKIRIPALPRPTLDEIRVQERFGFIKSIGADESPTGPVTLILGTVLRSDEIEDIVSGEEYEYRLRLIDGKLGFQHESWLDEHQDEFPEFRELSYDISIDFPGLRVLRDDGSWGFPALNECGNRWYRSWHWLRRDSPGILRIAVGR